jgi:hypothetical protein
MMRGVSMLRRSPSFLFAGLLMAVSFPVLADPYTDLPGVKDPQDQKKAAVDDIVCTSQIERQRTISPSFKRNGLGYRAYACEYGKVTVGSSRQPNMIEYRKFKERYQD